MAPRDRSARAHTALGVLVLLAVTAGCTVIPSGADRQRAAAEKRAKVMAAVAASTTTTTPSEFPAVGDHLHMAIGFDRCGTFADAPLDIGPDQSGIHAHPKAPGATVGDGLVHVHPFHDRTTGKSATLGVWFDSVGATVTKDVLHLANGFELPLVGDCDGIPARVHVALWDKADSLYPEVTDPESMLELRDIVVNRDMAVLGIELLPDRDRFVLPPSAANVSAPADVANAPQVHDHQQPPPPSSVP